MKKIRCKIILLLAMGLNTAACGKGTNGRTQQSPKLTQQLNNAQHASDLLEPTSNNPQSQTVAQSAEPSDSAATEPLKQINIFPDPEPNRGQITVYGTDNFTASTDSQEISLECEFIKPASRTYEATFIDIRLKNSNAFTYRPRKPFQFKFFKMKIPYYAQIDGMYGNSRFTIDDHKPPRRTATGDVSAKRASFEFTYDKREKENPFNYGDYVIDQNHKIEYDTGLSLSDTTINEYDGCTFDILRINYRIDIQLSCPELYQTFVKIGNNNKKSGKRESDTLYDRRLNIKGHFSCDLRAMDTKDLINF